MKKRMTQPHSSTKTGQDYHETKRYFTRLKARKPKNLDALFSELHDEVFEETNCLECANCCKTTSPIFTDNDIERIAQHFRIRPSVLIDRYLHLDEDNHYVLNSAPCVFLGADNYCGIYEVRPKACREYPHTNRRKMVQILDLTLENTCVCPAVATITERLQKLLP